MDSDLVGSKLICILESRFGSEAFKDFKDMNVQIFLLAFLRDKMICSSNVIFIKNPDPKPDPKLRLKPAQNPKKIISDPQH
jgi:hypothetical protein